jgi:oleandomycin transport system ATP-binding protein
VSYAIQTEGLVKKFGATTALAGVDLAVAPGKVLGLLGPNGAGKTTAVRVLATLLRPDGGQARVCGYDVVREADRVRASIGLTGQYAAVDGDLSGYENLLLVARLLELRRPAAKKRANRLLELFGLAEAGRRPVREYSGGMRRRLDLAVSLITRPQVLFLDEPTTGLDPRSRQDAWRVVQELISQGVTVLLTTQYLDEADRLADEIAVIDNGRVIASGTPEELKAKVGGQTLEVRPTKRSDRTACAAIVAEIVGAQPTRRGDDQGVLSVTVDDPGAMTAVVKALDRRQIPVTELALRLASLDEVFMVLTGHTANEKE